MHLFSSLLLAIATFRAFPVELGINSDLYRKDPRKRDCTVGYQNKIKMFSAIFRKPIVTAIRYIDVSVVSFLYEDIIIKYSLLQKFSCEQHELLLYISIKS